MPSTNGITLRSGIETMHSAGVLYDLFGAVRGPDDANRFDTSARVLKHELTGRVRAILFVMDASFVLPGVWAYESRPLEDVALDDIEKSAVTYREAGGSDHYLSHLIAAVGAIAR